MGIKKTIFERSDTWGDNLLIHGLTLVVGFPMFIPQVPVGDCRSAYLATVEDSRLKPRLDELDELGSQFGSI
jgi:hypothetical protein